MSQQYRYPNSAAVTVAAVGANGAPIPSQSILIGGVNPSANLQPISVDASGNVNVNIVGAGGGATAANQVLEITQLTNIDTAVTALNVRTGGSLTPVAYDYVANTYVVSGNGTGQIATATYKSGGAGGTTVATLTFAYDGSDRLSSVTKT